MSGEILAFGWVTGGMGGVGAVMVGVGMVHEDIGKLGGVGLSDVGKGVKVSC